MTDPRAALLDVLRDLAGQPTIEPAHRLRADLGLSSIQLIEALARFETVTKVDLATPLERLGRPVETVADLLRALEPS